MLFQFQNFVQSCSGIFCGERVAGAVHRSSANQCSRHFSSEDHSHSLCNSWHWERVYFGQRAGQRACWASCMINMFYIFNSQYIGICFLQEPGWQGWSVPLKSANRNNIYGKDVLHFARWFLTNLLDRGSKGLSKAFRIGSRNICILEGCFFQAAFTHAVRESQMTAGVKYSVDQTCFQEDGEYILTSASGSPDPGNDQLFPNSTSATSTSVWVTDSGFFYVFSCQPMVSANSKFFTPVWMLKARMDISLILKDWLIVL